MSSRRNPFEEIEELFERMSRQFDDSAPEWESGGPLERLASGTGSTAVDIVEHDGEFVVTVDLPGFESDDVDVSLTDNTLVVDAESGSSVDEEEGQYLRRERRRESVRRSVQLPGAVAKDEASARMNNGVLTVTLPKIEIDGSSTIEIEEE